MDERFTINRCIQMPRPIRNKRQSKRSCIDGERPPKRLFTPEIKKYLKDWLVRRRDNPYPNRDEKKILAMETGLTYIQICNWFANWRRKLKSSGKSTASNSWGHLIKTYNDQASGNIEQFSICSDDSIWEESNSPMMEAEDLTLKKNHRSYCEEKILSAPNVHDHAQCFTISSTTEDSKFPLSNSACRSPNSINKYKNNIMEKYLKGLQSDDNKTCENNHPLQLTKWLVSAAKFQPSQNNYSIWNSERHSKNQYQNNIPKMTSKINSSSIPNITKVNDHEKPLTEDMILCKNVKDDPSINNEDIFEHGLEEVEAAVALTRLAGLYKSL